MVVMVGRLLQVFVEELEDALLRAQRTAVWHVPDFGLSPVVGMLAAPCGVHDVERLLYAGHGEELVRV